MSKYKVGDKIIYTCPISGVWERATIRYEHRTNYIIIFDYSKNTIHAEGKDLQPRRRFEKGDMVFYHTPSVSIMQAAVIAEVYYNNFPYHYGLDVDGQRINVYESEVASRLMVKPVDAAYFKQPKNSELLMSIDGAFKSEYLGKPKCTCDLTLLMRDGCKCGGV
jgi:hypothetical protein